MRQITSDGEARWTMAKHSSPIDVDQFAAYVHKLHERTEKFVDQRPGAPLSDALEELLNALAEAAHQRYLDLFEFSPDAYIVTDEHGRIDDVNQTAIQMFKLDRQD